MKTLEALRSTPRLLITAAGIDGGTAAAFLASSKKEQTAMVVFSWGCGWDHVSVSYPNRCPTWDEMCEIKSMFFLPDEVCVQYHPAENEYVNNHRHCLHIWHYQKGDIPAPPSWMVGLKKGQSYAECMRQMRADLEVSI